MEGSILLPVVDDGNRLGHVMIDPKRGSNRYTAWSVIDHPEREELLSSRVDRDDFRQSATERKT